MDISRVVVDTDGYEGSVSEELEPIAEQLSRDEVAEPGGQLLVLSDHCLATRAELTLVTDLSLQGRCKHHFGLIS